MSRLKIAVVGAGVFGITAAVRLARRGYVVDLFEKRPQILMGASGINQYRLHRGHHYPRSLETALSCRDSEASFREEYGEAVLSDFEHYYCVSRARSRTSPEQLLRFFDSVGLEYTASWVEVVRREVVALCVRVRESLLDLESLRAICFRKLRSAGVRAHLRVEADELLLDRYDFAVVATYSTLNALLNGFPGAQRDYQFELCEKPVVRLPQEFTGRSIVILDGPFMCIDPFGKSGLFVLGNVVHAIHRMNVGRLPVIDEPYRAWMNNGIVRDPPMTHFRRFVSSASEFFHGIERAEHLGSMFTVRAVLPDRDETDERPTLVKRVGEKMLSIFSGKIGTCVEAADLVVKMVEEG